MKYTEFLESKRQMGIDKGFKPIYMPGFLYDFQRHLVEWALLKGRSAIFADCGLGKTPMQLVWAENIIRHTNKPVLILTPLAVASQTIREGNKFDIEVYRSLNGQGPKSIIVSNYERLHYFDPAQFAGVVCDESSILKSFDGARRQAITEFMRQVPYRLLCTATAAPNDYIELGTSSEALGELGYTDMLTRFFTPVSKGGFFRRSGWDGSQFRFKGYAEQPFWRWVCSWSRAMRKPSDLGYNDSLFILPELKISETIIKANRPREGLLFDIPAVGFHEERGVKRRTITERAESALSKIDKSGKAAVIWCQLNAEADTLVKLYPEAKQVSGSDDDESKEEKFEAFRSGQLRVLVIKPKIGAYGLNWQHCSHVVYFVSHSYEQYYQAVRRCWRFGQTHPVEVDLIRTEAEERVMSNLQRKARAADKMFTDLVKYMNHVLAIERPHGNNKKMEVPKWL